MAQTVMVRLTDDMDGGEAAETVSFALDGVPYAMDLSAEHAEELRGAMAPFIANARRGKAAKNGKGSKPRRPRASRGDSQAIREWAAAEGIHLAPRGRIPDHVIDRYRSQTAA